MHTVALSGATPRPEDRACGVSASIAHAKLVAHTFDYMITEEELQCDTEKMLSLCSSAKLSFDDCLYMRNTANPEERAVIENDVYVQRSMFVHGVFAVLQITKLFGGKNDDYAIAKLLNKLFEAQPQAAWRDKLDRARIQGWQDKLASPEVSDPAQRLRTLRDKHFAHADKGTPSLDGELRSFWTDMPILLDLADEIAGAVSVDVCGQYYYHVLPESTRASSVLKRLSIHLERRHLDLVSRDEVQNLLMELPESFRIERALDRIVQFRDQKEKEFSELHEKR
jgi:hypothetical protein